MWPPSAAPHLGLVIAAYLASRRRVLALHSRRVELNLSKGASCWKSCAELRGILREANGRSGEDGSLDQSLSIARHATVVIQVEQYMKPSTTVTDMSAAYAFDLTWLHKILPLTLS